ncbi:hypothetical protein GWI33_012599 [Rhynchophorus ferrugineus]|uniref:Uncharacterized protein n=1 Tax=Rhynchophorus ferrugineus TaxID=354439 RepID=A0A834I9T9_RHYFE|nr:hypothetical protein GWI33_012599 [Rhynchophorus ferrugineus]
MSEAINFQMSRRSKQDGTVKITSLLHPRAIPPPPLKLITPSHFRAFPHFISLAVHHRETWQVVSDLKATPFQDTSRMPLSISPVYFVTSNDSTLTEFRRNYGPFLRAPSG